MCANGTLLLSHIVRFDSVSYVNYKRFDHDNVNRISPLVKVFGRRLIDEIECAFEGTIYSWHGKMPVATVNKIKKLRSKLVGRPLVFFDAKAIRIVGTKVINMAERTYDKR